MSETCMYTFIPGSQDSRSWSAHDSGRCRLALGLDIHPYVSAPAVTGPKVQRHDGAVVGLARSAAHGPACSSAVHGPTCGAARVSPKKPSRSRPVERSNEQSSASRASEKNEQFPLSCPQAAPPRRGGAIGRGEAASWLHWKGKVTVLRH
jgi:hypothetical protein